MSFPHIITSVQDDAVKIDRCARRGPQLPSCTRIGRACQILMATRAWPKTPPLINAEKLSLTFCADMFNTAHFSNVIVISVMAIFLMKTPVRFSHTFNCHPGRASVR